MVYLERTRYIQSNTVVQRGHTGGHHCQFCWSHSSTILSTFLLLIHEWTTGKGREYQIMCGVRAAMQWIEGQMQERMGAGRGRINETMNERYAKGSEISGIL